jgi:hypothetical protein
VVVGGDCNSFLWAPLVHTANPVSKNPNKKPRGPSSLVCARNWLQGSSWYVQGPPSGVTTREGAVLVCLVSAVLNSQKVTVEKLLRPPALVCEGETSLLRAHWLVRGESNHQPSARSLVCARRTSPSACPLVCERRQWPSACLGKRWSACLLGRAPFGFGLCTLTPRWLLGLCKNGQLSLWHLALVSAH